MARQYMAAYIEARPRNTPVISLIQRGQHIMLKWALIFAVISVIAGLMGFGGVAAGAAGIAKVLFFVFLAICLLFVVLALLGIGALRK
jgi:uncharacterized membrane protein YtjA (UPF0391 family)